MSTGRAAITAALRDPMTAHGWRPRAAGFFTRQVASGHLGVAAVGAASKRTEPGAALATVDIGLRVDGVETVVSALCGVEDAGYRSWTAATGIGYLMPERSWREWLVSEANAEAVAAEMTEATSAYAVPWLVGLATNVDQLLLAVRRSPAWVTAPGWCRAVVLLVRAGRTAEAGALVEERLREVSGRTDRVAETTRVVAGRIRDQLLRS